MKTGLQLWAGSQQSYEQYLEGMLKARADAGFKADMDFEEEVLSRVLNIDSGVAVINISGSLVDGSAGFGVFFGVLGYNDIRNALAAAVADASVGSILLNVSSEGGMVSGCHETAQLIARVNTIKPVVTYTGSVMGSAAVWTGSQARHIVAGETAMVGSIGIIMVHMDRSEQLKQSGIKATIIRAGAEKCLATPFETLSDEAKAQMQGQADTLYDIFLPQVALARGVTAANGDKKFGQGKVFIGKAAMTCGLVDAIGTFEDAFAKAQSLIKTKKPVAAPVRAVFGATNVSNVQAQASTMPVLLADNLTNPTQGTEIMSIKKPLSAEQLTAMAAGVVLDDETVKTAEELAAEAAAAAAAGEASKAAALESESALASAALAPAATAAAPSEATLMLQGMLAAANADLVTVRAESAGNVAALAAANTALVAANAALAPAVEIARNSVRTMGLHFGVTSDAAAAMSPADVLSEHARLAGLFQAKFKAGGVAATSLGKPEAVASAPTMTVREQQIAMKLPRTK